MSLPNKVLNNVSNQVKTTIGFAISQDMPFSCTTADLSTTEGQMATREEANLWLHNLFNKTLAYKPLPKVALENMRKKGLTPKKQPKELYLFVIISTKTHVHVAVSVPKDKLEDIDDFYMRLTDSLVKTDPVPSFYNRDNVSDNEVYFELAYDMPFKQRDVVHRKIFSFLKEEGIYQEDEGDDEMVYDF